ncbi:MAG: AAA family ATPase, partial [Pseudomonadales bacterium]|nr:AAA family ATPase [Pseudomonadales bacterium]
MALIPGYQITKTLVNSRRSCVLRATRDSDACPVIIKQLNATPEPGQLSRFSFCYDIICQLSHPNIAKGLEWLDTVGRPTMIMEDIGGVESLAFLNSFPRQQFPLPLFLKLAIEAVDALVAIHRQHIIHKDLHPGNIVVNPQTHRLQIIDFGLATLLSREQPLLEPVDRLEGAIPYIAPEQTGRMNRALDYRADFYTLGATFYHWLVGQPPFGLEKTDNSAQLVHAHVAKIPEPVDSFRHDVPKVLVSIIEKLLQKTAEARYQSAIGLLKDLQRCQRALSQNIDTPEFPLGMDDVSDRLQIPQKLYGRQSEVDLLMAEFFSASKGQARVVAVGGYSGVGKSALVHEIHKPIAAVNGIFVSGKFDQFQSNTPYAALKVAIGNWLKYALTMDESAFRALKDELLATLGDNARVLIDFMAMFSSLLGDLPAVAKLGSDETKTR